MQEKLASERDLREGLEVEVQAQGARATEFSERLQVAEMLLKEACPSTDSDVSTNK